MTMRHGFIGELSAVWIVCTKRQSNNPSELLVSFRSLKYRCLLSWELVSTPAVDGWRAKDKFLQFLLYYRLDWENRFHNHLRKKKDKAITNFEIVYLGKVTLIG